MPMTTGDMHMARVTAADGYEIVYRVWEPRGEARGTIALLNGIMSHSGWFEPLAPELQAAGFRLVGVDRRGTGANRAARGDAPSAETLIADARAIVAREHQPGAPLHLGGWCWGAVLAVNLAAEIPDQLTSLMLLTPGLFPTGELKRRMAEQEPIARARPVDEACLASPITEEMFTSGPGLDFIARDPDRLALFTPRFHAAMAKLGLGARIKLARLALPMLVVLASDDRATDNLETERGFAKLGAARARAIEFLTIPGAHGLQFDAPDALAAAMTGFACRATTPDAIPTGKEIR